MNLSQNILASMINPCFNLSRQCLHSHGKRYKGLKGTWRAFVFVFVFPAAENTKERCEDWKPTVGPVGAVGGRLS